MPKFYIASVYENNDPDKEGKIQFYIESLMYDFLPTEYPWARPAIGSMGGSADFGISNIPAKNSKIWIFYEDEEYWRNPFYLFDVNLKNLNHHNLYEQDIKISVGASSSYPDVKFIYFENGICLAVSSSSTTPEITIYHPKAYMFLDRNGHLDYEDNEGNTCKADTDGWNFNDYLTIKKPS